MDTLEIHAGHDFDTEAGAARGQRGDRPRQRDGGSRRTEMRGRTSHRGSHVRGPSRRPREAGHREAPCGGGRSTPGSGSGRSTTREVVRADPAPPAPEASAANPSGAVEAPPQQRATSPDSEGLPAGPPSDGPAVPSICQLPVPSDQEGRRLQLAEVQRRLAGMDRWHEYVMGLLCYLATHSRQYGSREGELQRLIGEDVAASHQQAIGHRNDRIRELEGQLTNNRAQHRAIEVLRSALATLEAPPTPGM